MLRTQAQQTPHAQHLCYKDTTNTYAFKKGARQMCQELKSNSNLGISQVEE